SIAGCLESVARFEDVHVLDSGSTDRTIEIAQAHGVSVHHHAFHGFGQQRSWAIDNIATRYTWQFHLDADERMTAELAEELSGAVAAASPCGGYFVPSK